MSKKIRKSGITRRGVLGVAGAGAVLAASPFRINLLRAQETPIKVGFPVPLTGPYGTEAQDQANCAQLAIDEFNEAGGLDGRKAELLVRDDKLNPGEGATRALELIEQDKVNFICGSLSASVQLAVNNVTKERGIIYNSISQSDTINEASDFSKYTFHEAMNPHMTAGAVGRHVFPKFGKKVAFLTADYAYGHEMVRGFLRAGEAFGIEPLEDIRHPLATTDYSTLLPRIQAMKPDVLIITNFGRDQQISLKQATDFGLKNSIQIVAPILLFTGRLSAGAKAFEGVIGGTSYYWGIEDKIDSAKAFNSNFAKKYGEGKYPSDYGAMGYSGVKALLEASKAAGSIESDKVIPAMEALKYDYYKGPQYFRGCDHQSVQSVFIITSKSNGANESDVFEVIATDEPNEDNLRSCEELGHKA